jgi:hypothetical protein
MHIDINKIVEGTFITNDSVVARYMVINDFIGLFQSIGSGSNTKDWVRGYFVHTR